MSLENSVALRRVNTAVTYQSVFVVSWTLYETVDGDFCTVTLLTSSAHDGYIQSRWLFTYLWNRHKLMQSALTKWTIKSGVSFYPLCFWGVNGLHHTNLLFGKGKHCIFYAELNAVLKSHYICLVIFVKSGVD